MGDTFSENPFYNDHVNVGEILSVAGWVATKESPVIYDIGGHCGFIATQLAQILRSSNPVIYSFEPVAPTFTDLMYSINELALGEFIRPVPVALGSRAGFVRLSYSKLNSMLAQVIPENQTSNRRGGEEIYLAPVLTIEDFGKIALGADVIKIDVEGYEVPVFNGMQKLMLSEGFNHTGICLVYILTMLTPCSHDTDPFSGMMWKSSISKNDFGLQSYDFFLNDSPFSSRR